MFITKSTSGLFKELIEQGWFPTTNLILFFIASKLLAFFNGKIFSLPRVLYCSFPIGTAGKIEMIEPIIEAKCFMLLLLRIMVVDFLLFIEIVMSTESMTNFHR